MVHADSPSPARLVVFASAFGYFQYSRQETVTSSAWIFAGLYLTPDLVGPTTAKTAESRQVY